MNDLTYFEKFIHYLELEHVICLVDFCDWSDFREYAEDIFNYQMYLFQHHKIIPPVSYVVGLHRWHCEEWSAHWMSETPECLEDTFNYLVRCYSKEYDKFLETLKNV